MVKVNFLCVSFGLSGKFSGVFLNIWSDIFFWFWQKRKVENEIEWIGKDKKKKLPDSCYVLLVFFSLLREYGPSI